MQYTRCGCAEADLWVSVLQPISQDSLNPCGGTLQVVHAVGTASVLFSPGPIPAPEGVSDEAVGKKKVGKGILVFVARFLGSI